MRLRHLNAPRWPLAAAIALATGCQAPAGPGLGTSMQLEAIAPATAPAPVAAAVPVEVASVTAPAPAAPAATPAPPRFSGGSASGSSGGSAPVPAPPPVGSLTLDLASVAGALPQAGQWRVLAAVADVEKLIITVKQAGRPDQVQTVLKSEMQAGKTAVTFSDLLVGTCTVTIVAEDIAGTPIGTSSRVAPIVSDQDTKAELRTMIVPDDGNGWHYLNSLVFGVDLEPVATEPVPEGGSPASGSVVASFPVPGVGGLYADGAGHFWIIGGAGGGIYTFNVTGFNTSDGSHFQMALTAYSHGLGPRLYPPSMVYNPAQNMMLATGGLPGLIGFNSGAPFIRIVDTGGRVGNLAVDAEGNAFYARQGLLQRLTDDTITPTTIPAHSAVAIDTAGKFWVNGADVVAGKATVRNEVARYEPDGTLLSTVSLPFPAVRIVSDGLGGVWVGDRPGGQVVRVAAEGTIGAPLGVTATDFCVDADHHLWVAGGPSLLKLAPDGSELGNFPIQASSVTAGDGHIFVGTAGSPPMVMKLIP